ncbi:phosphoglycerate mutase-like protein [Parathielavia appendiculata]|uniref:Phosphoglycerate mutase-like protein n=1 Tax=Parathielavia appendiculata TaxID=2587402 RepID=A0AAN6U0J6_9PEZI|nr:phosphoglycerate mutase-like protein [Parathielavia appendiculata]
MLQVIYVTRHGFRSNWLVDPSSGNYTTFIKSPTGGAADPALTAHGVDQSNELAVRLLAAHPPIERVYSSLYYRCLQTVEPFVRKAQEAVVRDRPVLRIRGETGLGEWYGSADFEHPVPAGLEKLDSLFPGLLDLSYEPAVTPNRMGESIDELHARVAATLEALIAQCDRDGVRSILLCSHAAVIIALGRVLTGRMPATVETRDFKCFTCGLSLYRRRRSPGTETQGNNSSAKQGTAEIDADCHRQGGLVQDWSGGQGVSGAWNCELNSDCTHLSLGEERGWAFSGDESFKDMATGQSMLNTTMGLGVVVDDRSRLSGRHAEDTRGKL